MFKKKILVVEDSEMMLRLIRDVLEKAGYDVVTAVNGRQGLNLVAVEKPDLTILDVVMPEMDGFEVCKVLRDDEGNNLMPIIMLTAQGNEEDKLTGLELGADDYILKPFNPRELTSRVRNTLMRIDRNRRANPLTGLQGNLEIQSEINHRLATGRMLAVAYADLDNFKAYNDVYGFVSGDRAIRLLADVIKGNIVHFGAGDEFLGHIGGDDFVFITEIETVDQICDKIIEEFDKRVLELYSPEDLARGYIDATNRQGQPVRYPVISLSIAVATNENRKISSYAQCADILAEVKKMAKMTPGSVCFKDRRKD